MTLEIKAQATLVDGVLMMVCGYFAACTNTTLKAVDNPAVGPVPVCARCQARMGIPDGRLMDVEVQIGS